MASLSPVVGEQAGTGPAPSGGLLPPGTPVLVCTYTVCGHSGDDPCSPQFLVCPSLAVGSHFRDVARLAGDIHVEGEHRLWPNSFLMLAAREGMPGANSLKKGSSGKDRS